MVQALAIGLVVTLSFQSSSRPPQSSSTDQRSWSRAYDDALKAIGRKDWNAAIASLERAKEAGPRPARNISTYGDNLVTFVPDYYLGVAYLNLGRFAEADAAFERTLQQNVLNSKDREWAALQSQSALAAFEHHLQIANERLNASDFREAMVSVELARKRGVGAELARVDKLRDIIVEREAAAKTATTRGNPQLSIPSGGGGVPSNLGKPVGQLPSPTFPGPANTGAAAANPSGGGSTTSPPSRGQQPPPSSTVTPPPSTPGTGTATARGLDPKQTAMDPEQAAMTRFFNGQYEAAEAEFRALATGPYATSRHEFFLACSLAARVLAGESARGTLDEARQIYARVGGRNQFRTESTFISPRILDTLDGK